MECLLRMQSAIIHVVHFLRPQIQLSLSFVPIFPIVISIIIWFHCDEREIYDYFLSGILSYPNLTLNIKCFSLFLSRISREVNRQ